MDGAPGRARLVGDKKLCVGMRCAAGGWYPQIKLQLGLKIRLHTGIQIRLQTGLTVR